MKLPSYLTRRGLHSAHRAPHSAFPRRSAFTLVEMLVAIALVLFLMVLMSQAFVAALEVFRQLKAIGDMEERLRTVSLILRRELAADHFEGKKRLSDSNFWQNGPPSQGFVRIYHGSPIMQPVPGSSNPLLRSPSNTWEELDGDGVPSVRSTNHALQMAVRLRGNSRQDFFRTAIDSTSPLNLHGQPDARYQEANTFTSQWAEVAYFLQATNNYANGTPLYALFRRQRLAVGNSDTLNQNPIPLTSLQASGSTTYAEVSARLKPNVNNTGMELHFNNPSDLTVPNYRFAGSNSSSPSFVTLADEYGSLGGSDLLLTDVISFDIRVLIDDPLALSGQRLINNNVTNLGFDPFVDLYDSQAWLLSSVQANIQPLAVLTSRNKDYKAIDLTNPTNTAPRILDTWSSVNDGVMNYTTWNIPDSSTTVPITPVIKALQITIRVWDRNTEQTRQITIVQDM